MKNTDTITNAATNAGTLNKVIALESFGDRMNALAKKLSPMDFFNHAYQYGNQRVIPSEAIAALWKDFSLAVEDGATTYTDAMYHIHYCAQKYFEFLPTNEVKAVAFRDSGMATWANLLKLVGCPYKRTLSDWIYFLVSAFSVGKAGKDDCKAIVKAVGRNAFRRKVEILIGMAINGYAYECKNESLGEMRENARKKAEAKEEKKAAAAEKRAEKAANVAAKAAERNPVQKEAVMAAVDTLPIEELPTIDDIPLVAIA